ncbi:hypothetical protein F4779DRAFT_50597 [Xylariaceae sp. FL0662B]|nr:hypothetical protein F4779DRAFT_50597 [Xylariaceae sp. FL0662B]
MQNEQDEETPKDTNQVEQYEETPKGTIQNWLKYNTFLPSQKEVDYDWYPLISALAENRQDKKDGKYRELLPICEPTDDDDKNTPGQKPDHSVSYQDPRRTVPKIPGSGSWEYTWYIPEWSHPDFNPDYEVRYQGARWSTKRDPMLGLYPALRAEDAYRRPTPYALRFGIYPDQTGGRSRFSPTFSSTREPGLVDVTNQIDMLTEPQREKLTEMSRQYVEGLGETYIGGIDARLLDNLLSRSGAMNSTELMETIKAQLDNGFNLEQFAMDLFRNNRFAFAAHKNFLQNNLKDQNIQRLLFQDLTTDELIQNNIHTMADDVACDLEGDLHPLMERWRWDDCMAKGALDWDPRLLYNLNGERQEWNVRTNDTLWNALQPALQLITRVLNSWHPALIAVMDLRTRQPVDSARDGRTNPETPFITKFVQQQDMDISKTYQQIRELNDLGYNWCDEVMRVLHRHFRLDLSAAHLGIGESTEGVPIESDNFSYGWTFRWGAEEGTTITSYVSVELIWPLLVPQYSQSEKMAASFQIATTLLHEIGHAINYCHQLLTYAHDERCAEPPGQDPQITNLLNSLGAELWDFDSMDGEHVFEDTTIPEMGFAFERLLWGFVGTSFIQNYSHEVPRYLRTSPLMNIGMVWPFSQPPIKPWWGTVRGAIYPVEDYCIPLRIDYMAKFFSQKFWDTDFQKYGFEAMKMLPTDRVHKVTMTETWNDVAEGQEFFGREKYTLLKTIQQLLDKNGFIIISTYLDSTVKEILRPRAFLRRWKEEVLRWSNGRLTPLPKRISRLTKMLKECQVLHANKVGSGVQEWNKYVDAWVELRQAGIQAPEPLSLGVWKATVIAPQWTEMFREGGQLMQLLSETHRAIQDELAYLERMMLDYHTLDEDQRWKVFNILNPVAESPIEAAYQRMLTCRPHVAYVLGAITSLSQQPQMLAVKDQWDQWAAIYKQNHERYGYLIYLMASGNDFKPNDMIWKTPLRSLPSSYLKNRSDRLRMLAHQEYVKLDPRIRQVVDDFGETLAPFREKPLVNPYNEFETQAIEAKMTSIQELGASVNLDNATSLFDWRPEGQVDQPIQFDGIWQQVARDYQAPRLEIPDHPQEEEPEEQQPEEQQPQELPPPRDFMQTPQFNVGQSTSSIPEFVFGQANAVFNPARDLGAVPPRRTLTAEPANPEPGSSRAGSAGPSLGPSLGPTSSGGARKDRPPAGFKRYATSFQEETFSSTAAKQKPLGSFAAPTSQPAEMSVQAMTLDLNTPSMFPPPWGTSTGSPVMFPSPYAGPSTLTPDVIAYQEALRANQAAETLANMQSTLQPYSTSRLWRDMGQKPGESGQESGDSSS